MWWSRCTESCRRWSKQPTRNGIGSTTLRDIYGHAVYTHMNGRLFKMTGLCKHCITRETRRLYGNVKNAGQKTVRMSSRLQ